MDGLTDAERQIFTMFFDRQMFNFETVIVAYEEGPYDPNGRFWLTQGNFSITDRARIYLGLSSEKVEPQASRSDHSPR